MLARKRKVKHNPSGRRKTMHWVTVVARSAQNFLLPNKSKSWCSEKGKYSPAPPKSVLWVGRDACSVSVLPWCCLSDTLYLLHLIWVVWLSQPSLWEMVVKAKVPIHDHELAMIMLYIYRKICRCSETSPSLGYGYQCYLLWNKSPEGAWPLLGFHMIHADTDANV